VKARAVIATGVSQVTNRSFNLIVAFERATDKPEILWDAQSLNQAFTTWLITTGTLRKAARVFLRSRRATKSEMSPINLLT
jgi:hypothetical protein